VKKKLKIFVGVSGGVDSSVSAALLKDAGHDVIGVFIRTWTPEWTPCTWRDERRDAMRVCAHLGIPFLECDAEEAYKRGVADYMIEEYKLGRTPNPDVMCNRVVKFGALWEFAQARGADAVATGHYAQVRQEENFAYTMLRGVDEAKDQSYFLWTLQQADLEHTFFPIGHLPKDEVRKLAKKYRLPTATKKDSQGVCFLGLVDMKEFLAHYIETKEGDVLDRQGNVIGKHPGALFFTIGERHGFETFKKSDKDKPQYVIAKDMKTNTITVTELEERKEQSEYTEHAQVELEKVSWVGDAPVKDEMLTAQLLYHGKKIACSVGETSMGKVRVILYATPFIASGQSVVIYRGEVCVGGGIVA
jgi:tRNA-specific 2-thiouridylase